MGMKSTHVMVQGIHRVSYTRENMTYLEHRTTIATKLLQVLCCFSQYRKKQRPAIQILHVTVVITLPPPCFSCHDQMKWIPAPIAGDGEWKQEELTHWTLDTQQVWKKRRALLLAKNTAQEESFSLLTRLLQPHSALRSPLSLRLGLDSPVFLDRKYSLYYLLSLCLFFSFNS